MEEMRPTPGATSRRWAPKYRPLRFLLVVPLAMALALATSYHEASAAAVNQGPCQFFVNGVPSTQFDTQDHALHVASDQDLVISGKAPVAFRSWVAWIEFADFQYTAASGNSQKDTFSSTVNVKTYAKFGVGMYKVLSEAKLLPSNSPDCIADGYVLGYRSRHRRRGDRRVGTRWGAGRCRGVERGGQGHHQGVRGG